MGNFLPPVPVQTLVVVRSCSIGAQSERVQRVEVGNKELSLRACGSQEVVLVWVELKGLDGAAVLGSTGDVGVC